MGLFALIVPAHALHAQLQQLVVPGAYQADSLAEIHALLAPLLVQPV